MNERYLQSSPEATVDDRRPMSFGGENVPPGITTNGRLEIVQIAPASQETSDSSIRSDKQRVIKKRLHASPPREPPIVRAEDRFSEIF